MSMRATRYLLPTLRDAPGDAVAESHKLLVRAGMVKQVGAGMWTWLPLGWRVKKRVQEIIREEMDRIGGQEMLMPVLHPAEIWKRSGRYDLDVVFHLRDRADRELVLAITHEEIVALHASQTIRSYRDLPQIWYHIQIKERDEPRPERRRAAHPRVHDEGLLHARPRPGRPGRGLREARGGLRPHLPALRPRRSTRSSPTPG